MTFRDFANYLQQLENTSSRNAMVEILARLFKEADKDEIDKVVYLTQGRVAPLFEPVEFGVGEKLMIKAIADASDKSVDEVTKEFKKTGDLGETVYQLKVNKVSKVYKVIEVFEKLVELARTGGEGSVDKKTEIITLLLKDLDPLSSKYIVRMVLDKLRLGFSDMTVLEGLSWMVDGTKKLKPKFESVYNVRPDLGHIAVSVKQLGVSEGIVPEVGMPVLPMRAERSVSAEEILEQTRSASSGQAKCAVEPKLDGLRTQLHFKRLEVRGKGLIKLYSRGLEDVTNMYPDLVEAAKKELDCDEVILDGEAIGYDPKTDKYLPFQETVQRKRKYDIDLFSESVPIKLIVFDVLHLNGKSLINEPYSKRREILEKVLPKKGILAAARMTVVTDPKDLDKYFNECVAKGLEGIVAKKLDGVYQAGARGWNWIKFKKSYESKLADTVDAVVMGIDEGQGKRSGFGVGAFLIGVYDTKTETYKTISKIGTGLTDEEWKDLKIQTQSSKLQTKPDNYDVNKLMNCDHWVEPKIVGEFKADELTKSPMHTAGLALRFPRLVRWRTDKKPTDTTSLQELGRIANLHVPQK